MAVVERVLNFWFGAKDSAVYGKPRSFWFDSTPEIDLSIKQQFSQEYYQARAGDLDFIASTPEGSLVLILLLDQVPRHIFRGTKKAFTTDIQALVFSKAGIAQGFDQQLPNFMKLFFYLPFEHSEVLIHQKRSLELFEALGDEEYLKYAKEHYQAIERFGRFPHRNSILNRTSTREEQLFLDQKSQVG
jgi:uncharacterized protein (DUF924 family)